MIAVLEFRIRDESPRLLPQLHLYNPNPPTFQLHEGLNNNMDDLIPHLRPFEEEGFIRLKLSKALPGTKGIIIEVDNVYEDTTEHSENTAGDRLIRLVECTHIIPTPLSPIDDALLDTTIKLASYVVTPVKKKKDPLSKALNDLRFFGMFAIFVESSPSALSSTYISIPQSSLCSLICQANFV